VNILNINILKYVFVLCLFGSNGIVASYILLNSYEIVFWRSLIASLFLLGAFLLTKQTFTFYRYKKHAFFLSLGGASLGLSWIFLFEAYTTVGVSVGTLLYYCGPVFVMALAPIVFKEKLTTVKLIGFLIVLGGMGLVNTTAFLEGKMSIGIVLGLLAAVMYATMVIFNKKGQQIQGLENTTIQLVSAFVLVAIYSFIKGGGMPTMNTESLLPILILGLINTGLGCYIYFNSLGQLPVQTVSILGYLEPLSALLFSALVLHETLTPIQLIGAACILGGAALGELYKEKQKIHVYSREHSISPK
jgi:drug/metabolite transporter (DMT)-like permease